MTPREWAKQKERLDKTVQMARRWVYPGQPAESREAAHQLLRDAEDALHAHYANRAKLVKRTAEQQERRRGVI